MKEHDTPLARMLGLSELRLVAVAGSGGKSTLLRLLAQELAGAGHPVILTTTTHIHPPRAGRVSDIWLLGRRVPSPPEVAERLAPGRALAVAGGHTLQGKLRGIDPAQAQALAQSGAWVLVEADGSARLPLKAWAPWEPALPGGRHHLVVLAGARGLGRPLDQDWVHRPERFARAAGLEMGRAVTAPALARVLLGPEGPFAAHPEPALNTLVINQADAVAARELGALARELARLAPEPPYARLLKASLRWGRLEPLLSGEAPDADGDPVV